MGESDQIARLRARVAELEQRAAVNELIRDQLPVIVWTTDRSLRFTWSGGAAVDGLTLTHDEVIGMNLYEYFRTQDPNFLPIASARRALHGDTVRYENEWSNRVFMVTMSPLRDSEAEIVGTLGVALDITEQRRAEDALLVSETRYRDLFLNATDVVYTHDLAGTLTDINRAGEKVLGYTRDALLRMNIKQLTTPEHRELPLHMTNTQLKTLEPANFELCVITKGGESLTLDVSTSLLCDADTMPIAVQGVARDVTQRKRLEEQVRQSQKMEAVGLLAGGVAHDFNNLLTGILGNAYLMKGRTRETGPSAEALHGIIEAAERASQLTQQLLGFARQGKNQTVPVDVHSIIRSVVSLLSRTIDKRVKIATRCDAPRAEVVGDSNQIYQMLLNLGLNGRDAMPDGGTLSFQTELRCEKLLITVRDTGVGIPDSIRHRIFEPFFTTKGPDRGTGLGLAMVYGIVQNHGGAIELESQPGSGTIFHITLPLSEHKAAKITPVDFKAKLPKAKGRLLVIDDEAVVRRVLSRMLEELGYEVTGANDSLEAIDFYKDNKDRIDLVILDLVMPKLGGKAVLELLRGYNPEIRAILSSGFSPDGAVQEILNTGGVTFLQKPYTMKNLSETVRAALDFTTAQTVVN